MRAILSFILVAVSLMAGADELRVATWNIYWLGSNGNNDRGEADYRRLREVADAIDADIIFLQEVESKEWAEKALGEGYDYYFSGREGAAQRVGVAVRSSKDIEVTARPYRHLDVGGLRYGIDATFQYGGKTFRALGIHLKSFCFEKPLSGPLSGHCAKLRRQMAPLEAWADEIASTGVPYMILGDFNRRLSVEAERGYGEKAGLWPALDDPEVSPSEDLVHVNAGVRAECWGGRYPQFIDHILVSTELADSLEPGSFAQWLYDQPGDSGRMYKLSDHCPISVDVQF